MNKQIKPLIGPGRFQWNAGAWFGSTLGSAAWMIVACGFLLIHGQYLLAYVPLTCFAIVLAGAILFWIKRAQVDPFSALFSLLILLSILFPFVWMVVSTFASPEALIAMNWPQSIWVSVLVSVIVPTVMLGLLHWERSAPSINRVTGKAKNSV